MARLDDDRTFGWGWGRHRWLIHPARWAYRFLHRSERYADPEKMVRGYEDAIATSIRIFGPDGGPTNNGRHHLATELERTGQLAEARVLREEVLNAYRRHRDSEDPGVLAAEEYLAANLYRSGMFDEARPLFTHVRDSRERTLGSEDPATQRPGNWLAAMDSNQEQG